jgi:hypothetical protein
MKVTKVSSLKRGLPETAGQEIKTVTFDLTASLPSAESIGAKFALNLQAWISDELGLDLDLKTLPNCSKSLLSNDDEEIVGYIALENLELGETKAFELQVVSKFYKGLETTRIRSIQTGDLISVQVSSFLESRNPVASLQEIPRIADSLLTGIAANDDIAISVDGMNIRQKVHELNADNISNSPLTLHETPGQMPLVGFLRSPRSLEVTEKLGDELFGLAHVLLLSDELFAVLKSKGYSESKFFVYWRDGSPGVSWYDITAQMYRFKRQLFTRSLREDSFSRRWRALVTKLSLPTKAQSPALVKNEVVDPLVAELRFELAIAKSEVEAANGRAKAVEREMDEIVAQYDETAKNWKRKIAEASEISARLHGQIKSGKISARDFIVQVDLSGETPTQNALEQLSLITDYAIVFTENAARAWAQAKKSGYRKSEVMEKALEGLARFAMDFRLKQGQFGMSFEDYAEYNHELVWEPADQALQSKTFTFEGKNWNQERHVKADITAISQGRGELGRIHFDLDTAEFRVIVNHIGGKQYKNKK